MRILPKILLVFVFVLNGIIGHSQNESYLLPLDNRVAVNPSFAGLNRNNSYRTGNQYYFVNAQETYNLFYASWDAYAEKLKGGVAINFGQGLISQGNISTSEFGFSYSGFPIKTKNGEILLTVGTNFVVATKQWTVAFLDKMLSNKDDPSSSPGNEFLRYTLTKPKIGFLWTNSSMHLGLTVAAPYRMNIASDAIESTEDTTPLSLVFYLSKNIDKKIRDLYSKPFLLSPELIVFYHEESIYSRLRLISEHTDKTWGFFIQNDYTNNVHSLGGTIGYRQNFYRLNLNAGMGLPKISKDSSFICELSLSIIIPPFNYSQIYPWSGNNKN
ncbi:MAG TPA: type IX secretion system membrane protein PorP/SprF [Draconibacterium sp.]|nr:type IX secretion system membrane protein PorP/SprF [Draconibacterium sp.]